MPMERHGVENQAEKNRLNYENIMHFYNKWGDFIFKEILIDKINQNHFITDKKLDISIVSKNNEFITKLVKDLNLTDLEVFKRYDAALYLVSAADGAEKYYIYRKN